MEDPSFWMDFVERFGVAFAVMCWLFYRDYKLMGKFEEAIEQNTLILNKNAATLEVLIDLLKEKVMVNLNNFKGGNN